MKLLILKKNIKNTNIFKNKNLLKEIKSYGFSDKRIAYLRKKKIENIQNKRQKLKVHTVFKKVDTCCRV